MLVLYCSLEPIFPQPTPDEPAAKCNADVCRLPDCNCGGKDIPGDKLNFIYLFRNEDKK